MRFTTALLQVLSLIGSLASAAAINKRQSTSQIYKFSGSPSAPEGIAARSNGQLLVSMFDKGELYTVDPATKKATKVATFTDCTCSAGIAEVEPDVFVVVAGQFAMSGGNKAGSWGLWKVDFTTGTTPTTTLLKKVPESGMWNGLSAFSNDTLLVGDASKGAVWRFNWKTLEYSIAIQDTSMAPPASAPIPMGLDGLRYFNGTVYFTNIFKNTYNKVAVDATGKATGAITAVWSNSIADDLWVGPDGTQYVATNTGGKVQKVTVDGKVSTIASIQSSTAVTLGKTDADKNTLYIAASNGVIASVKV